MKKFRNALILTLCALLLVGGTFAATLAYLTSQDSVTNTFTVGDVEITLDEAKVNVDGTLFDEGATRVDENEYDLYPAKSYIKDPVVHVADDSRDAWLFVKIDNGLKAIVDVTTIEDQMIANGWSLVDGKDNIYAYNRVVTKADANVKTFENFKIKADVDGATLAAYADAKIVVQAYAIQADGFNTSADAWAANPIW